MLLLLVTLLLIMEALLLALRRDMRSLCVFLSSLSLFAFISGILLYIAKKGGITDATSALLFGPDAIRRWMQYMVLTLGSLGYIVAIGRYAFPFFILVSAFSFSYFPLAIRMKRRWWLLLIAPVLSLIVYIPDFFKTFISGSEWSVKAVVYVSRIWVYLYVFAALAVMAYEYHSITSSFFKRRFAVKAMMLGSLAIVYALYANQDPAQIYLFYSNDYMWNLGLLYLAPGISDGTYAAVMALSFIASASGCISTLRHIRVILDDEHEEIALRQKAHEASIGVSMFIHGTKNELLASRILISRLERNGHGSPELDELKAMNEKLISRMEKLHSAMSRSSVHLDAVPLSSVIGSAVQKAGMACPGILIDSVCDPEIMVLADADTLAEAISNIVVNGWEANVAASRPEAVAISVRIERLWVSIAIQDSGNGIPKDVQRRIWEPFFSSKNSSSNWGMGMYFSRRMIRMHLGSVRFETKAGHGTRFIILLPRYDRRNEKAWLD